MNNAKKWLLVFGIATAGVIGGAGAVPATTAEHAPLTGDAEDKAVAPDGTPVESRLDDGYKVTSHEPDDESSGDSNGNRDDEQHDGDKDQGDSDDRGDDDASDVNDTDGPGDDEDDR